MEGRRAMPGFNGAADTLDVPGARLYYERRGTGPLLLMIGSPMDSTGFASLAGALAGEYTAVTYDPRGAPARIVVAAGATSKGQLANRSAVALADQLGTPVAEFPGNHAGFLAAPEQFGRELARVLGETS
jgi:pimeloyl-ACP methyl ester carboxylesterase